MSLALKALAWVAPGAAIKRARALTTLAGLDGTRAYDGARGGRRGASFSAGATSANVEIGPALARLRDRSRDLVRNTSAGARIVDIHVGHTIGNGINAVPDNGSDRIDKPLKQLWEDWCATSDIEGINCFGGQQAIAYRSMLEGGDCVIRRIPLRRDSGERVPLKLQVLEGDFIDAARDQGVFEQQMSRLGVGLGPFDRRTGYWLHAQHPGDFTFHGAPYASQFVPFCDVIHLYRQMRAGQVRGVPVLAPVLMNARDLADVMDAIVVKQRVEACFAGFVTKKEDGDPRISPKKDDARIDQMKPGMLAYLDQGETITFGQPSGQGQFEPVWITTMMGMSAGAGLTYDQVTGDLRQANYSSLNAGDIHRRRLCEQTQNHLLVPQVMRRTTGWFVEAAIMAGELKPRKGGYRWDYILPAVEPIDARKALEADILAVRAGRMTPQEFIASWGQDWRKVIADTTAFFQMLDKQPGGLVLDIDPRRVSQIGVKQNEPSAPAAPGAEAA
ncbi:phage portal protein [uncultured Methylobacterium sp.]|uniref:phage portal protein n=1 Tax=uncultured Methylobacterium sp. TaxID=157278 RepID=UPI0035CC3688